MGKELGVSMSSPDLPLSLCPHVFTNPEALQTQSIWLEASLHSHDWLSHWLIQTPTLSPSLEVMEGTDIFSPLITWLVLLAASPTPLGRVQKSSLLIRRHPFHLYVSEASAGHIDEDQIHLRKRFWSSE